MFANILSIFPSFHVLTDEKKFLYLFQCEEYDIVEIIVRGVNEIYNRNININIIINITILVNNKKNYNNEH
jgi:hypothetical protein